MNNWNEQVEAISIVAKALGELNEQVVFVGGAVISLYANNPGAEEIRPTKDVDISMSVASLSELEEMRLKLVQKGFTQTSEDNVMCRFRLGEIIVDVMNTKEVGWAPANPWFEPGLAAKQLYQLDDIGVWLLPLPYFLATKFTAFNTRGQNNPITSHDFEDIVYLLSSISNIDDKVSSHEGAVKDYLQEEFTQILTDPNKQEALEAHLPYDNKSARYNRVMKKLRHLTKIE